MPLKNKKFLKDAEQERKRRKIKRQNKIKRLERESEELLREWLKE